MSGACADAVRGVVAEPILVDTAAAATFVGVRPGTIHVWAHRHGLTKHGTLGRRLWDLRELQAIMDARDKEPT